jgi:hypothetical protein
MSSSELSTGPSPMSVHFDAPDIESQAPTSSARARRQSKRQNPVDPVTSRQRGSITWDREHGFDLEWDSPEDFHKWRESEQRAHGVELRVCHTRRPQGSAKSAVFSGSQLFVCARQGTGGIKEYKRKTKRESHQDSKRIDGGCPCRVLIKIYPHTRTILGRYTPDHSHPTGKDNLRYVRIRIPTVEQIMGLIRLGLSDREIVCAI